MLNPFFYPYSGGTETVILEVYRRLAKKHQITVVTSNLPGEDRRVEELFGIEVVRLKTDYINIPKAPLPYLKMYGVKEAIRQCGADIYHINNRFQYTLGDVNEIKKNGKLAITIHNSLPQNIDLLTDYGGFLYDAAIGRRIIGNADLITGVSTYAIRTTVPKRHLGRSHVVYNGVDYRAFVRRGRRDARVKKIRDRFGLDSSTLIDVGRLVPQKGHAYLINAVRRVSERLDVKLLILGDGPQYQYLKNLSERVGLLDSVLFAGKVGHDSAPYYYNASDLFSLQSTYEPASVALLEALSSEIFCTVARTGGMPEMMGKCGLYAMPKNPHSIYMKIMEALDMDRREKRRLSAEGRRMMMAVHDWGKISKQYETLFCSVCRD